MADQKKQEGSGNSLEGEGSYTATRNYNRHLAEHQQNEDVEALAERASEELEGEGGDELREAERTARRGPKGTSQSAQNGSK